jgi:hypothetical protein
MGGELIRYRISLSCSEVPVEVGPQAAIEIAEEFTHRPWHENAEGIWTQCHCEGYPFQPPAQYI